MKLTSLSLTLAFAAFIAGCGGETSSSTPVDDGSAGSAGVGAGGADAGMEADGGAGGKSGTGGHGGSDDAGGADDGDGGLDGGGPDGTDGQGGSVEPGPDAGTDAPSCAAGCGTAGCPPCPGPEMVVAHDNEGRGYRIDSTEVTNAQYGEFLAAQVGTASQPPFCSWNTSFVPDNTSSCKWLYDPLNRSDYPVVCIDWCDANAYCEWAGKRLCQKFGGAPAHDIGHPAQEWGAACNGLSASNVYPYGDTYDPKACNGKDYGENEVVSVASLPGCVGGVPGLYDMSGNAHEWNGACNRDQGPDDECSVAGGSWFEQAEWLKCQPGHLSPRSKTQSSVGFRCCAD